MIYDDFLIQIRPAAKGEYAVAVQSPAGEGSAIFEIPFSSEEQMLLREVSRRTERREARDIRPPMQEAGAPELTPQLIGTALFRALFTGEVLTLYHESLSTLRTSKRGLRVRLRFDPRNPSLAPLQSLPWELLCRPDTEDFLALSRFTPIVRSLDAHRPLRPGPRPPRLRILAVVSNPSGLPPLQVDTELRNLEVAWEVQEVEVVRLGKARREELREALLSAPFHVLHFLGHGGFGDDQGHLFFEGPSGAAQEVGGRALVTELGDFEDLRLVVLNACQSGRIPSNGGSDPWAGVANSLVFGGIPAVVAMRLPVSDRAAVAFSRALFERLAAGDPVDTAVVEGRLAIHRLDEQSGEWATPVLFLRGSDGRLFADLAPTSRLQWPWLAAGLLGMAAAAGVWLTLPHGRPAVSPEALVSNNQGIALAANGRDSEARKAFLAALTIDPHYGAALSNLSALEERSGDFGAALRHAQEAVAGWPRDAVLHFNLGSLLARLGRDEEALDSLSRAVELEPGYAEARNELGLIYLRLDRPGDARRELEAGLRSRSEMAPLHKNLAKVDLMEKRSREAIQRLERALSLYGVMDSAGKIETTYWLAVALAAEGRSLESCKRLEEVSKLDPAGLSEWALNSKRLVGEESCNR